MLVACQSPPGRFCSAAVTDQDRDHVARLLARLSAGDGPAADELLPVVYDELRAMAQRYMRQERPGHTLQATAIVHEVYLKLANSDAAFDGRAQFLAVAATAMRRLLINHSRDRGRVKRGGGRQQITLDRVLDAIQGDSVDVLVLDDALRRLAELDARQARIVELRVFGGLTVEEVADVLGIGQTTVKGEWSFARAWLKREFFGQG